MTDMLPWTSRKLEMIVKHYPIARPIMVVDKIRCGKPSTVDQGPVG